MQEHKKISFLILLGAILIAVSVLVLPFVTTADHGGIHLISCAVHTGAPGERIPGMLSPITDICSICDLLKLLEKAFNFIWFYLTVPIATVMLLYGGFLMVLPSFTGNTNQATKGRKVLLNTVLGLAIVFFAWIGVDSILKIMGAQFGTGVIRELGPWNEIKCTAPPIPIIGGPVDVVPPEYQCPAGVTTKIVDGLDVCDPGVQRAAVTRGSLIGSGSGQCSASNITQLNKNYGAMLDTVAQQEGVDPKLLRAIALIESSGNPNAVGPATQYGQACGLIQVLPSTAGQSCESLKNPEVGARAGAKYIRQVQNSPQVQRLGGNQKYVLMKYNATFQALEPSNDCRGMVKGECPINPGGFSQTIDYVSKVQSCLASL